MHRMGCTWSCCSPTSHNKGQLSRVIMIFLADSFEKVIMARQPIPSQLAAIDLDDTATHIISHSNHMLEPKFLATTPT